MAKYLFVYVGGDQGSEDTDYSAVTNAWIAWFGGLGDAVLDPGNPAGASSAVASDGSIIGATSGVGGYSVISADSLTAALEIAKGCPHLDANGTVEVYETFDAM